ALPPVCVQRTGRRLSLALSKVDPFGAVSGRLLLRYVFAFTMVHGIGTGSKIKIKGIFILRGF
ncbi:hypothetical protein LR032_03070, partial [Candidatus Bipolaricaulota bacterium]|nr:hypothetical protein [Candidatus Bipolaricaulota bacterium]